VEWVGRLQAAAEGASRWHQIGDRFREATAPEEQERVGAIVSAFQYDFIEPTEKERRDRWGPYGPMLELTDGRVYPMPLEDVSDEWLGLWTELADTVAHPAVRSRLHDLLWERRVGPRPDFHARSAADAFVELADGSWEPLDRAECLIRALEIARAVSDTGRYHQIVIKTVEAARASIGGQERKPGVALRLIESLMRLPASDQPQEVDGLLEDAEVAYAPDPWILQSIADLQVLRAGSDTEWILSIHRGQIERWRDAARRAEGLVRLRHLESALELARVHGIRDVAEELRKEIQGITPEEMDLKEISATVEVPREQVERFHNAFLAGEDWRECLTFFGSYGPPSGDYQKNLQTIDQLQKDHPLQFLFSKLILGPGNVPIRHPTTEEEHREVELSEQEARGIAFWAISAAEILDRIHLEKAEPEPGELTDFFTTSVIVPEVAERVDRAVQLYWKGQPDEASHLLVPRLEAIIREMCRQAGLAIIREPRGRKPGGVRLLGDLLNALEGSLDESWRRYLANLLIDPIGTNLRNRIAHALIPTVAREQTAVLVHAACFLRLLAPDEGSPAEG
jgi:hypothetical protein